MFNLLSFTALQAHLLVNWAKSDCKGGFLINCAESVVKYLVRRMKHITPSSVRLCAGLLLLHPTSLTDSCLCITQIISQSELLLWGDGSPIGVHEMTVFLLKIAIEVSSGPSAPPVKYLSEFWPLAVYDVPEKATIKRHMKDIAPSIECFLASEFAQETLHCATVHHYGDHGHMCACYHTKGGGSSFRCIHCIIMVECWTYIMAFSPNWAARSNDTIIRNGRGQSGA